MTDLFTREHELDKDIRPTPIHAVRPDEWELFAASLSPAQLRFAKTRNFTGEVGRWMRLANPDGSTHLILLGCGPIKNDRSGPKVLGVLGAALPAGVYELLRVPTDWNMALALQAWGMGAYRYDEFLSERITPPTLVVPEDEDIEAVRAGVAATTLCRDLINRPAGDLGPQALGEAVIELAEEFGAEHSLIVGEDLLVHNYPMIHAVGRAAHEPPRLAQFEWGNPDHPRLAVIGKGITFDTGGVNMKSAAGARLMKKDMGGAAHALALSRLIMAAKLPVRLHCLVSIAENAVSAGAYRPGDILRSRAGITVEIDNTDAEGRLVLGDALCRATEDEPDLMINFATLTGAARVAMGPEVAPFFCNRKSPIEGLMAQGVAQFDPIWQLPLWQPYTAMLSSPIADCKNSGGGFAGAITAGLFLEKFVKDRPWIHVDTYGWNPSARPAHPKGGDMYAVRALFAWLRAGGLNGDLSK